MNININSYGQLILINFNIDLISATFPLIQLIPQFKTDQQAFEVTAQIGTIDREENNRLFRANEYIYYTIQPDTFTTQNAGLWAKQGSVVIGSEKVVTIREYFQLLP